jgi:hypothetical protein
MPHEAISIRENGSYNDADNQKGKNTAIPAQEVQSCVQGMAAPYTAHAASIRAQELPKVHRFFT